MLHVLQAVKNNSMTHLSRCYTLKVLAETYVQRPFANVSVGVATRNIKSRNLFRNVETGLEMSFSSAILLWTLAMNHCQLVVPFSDWLTKRSVNIQSETRGAHHSTKSFGVNFRKFPWANGTEFSG